MIKLINILNEIQISNSFRTGSYFKSKNDVWVIKIVQNGIFYLENKYGFKIHGTKDDLKDLIKHHNWKISNKKEFELYEIQIKSLKPIDVQSFIYFDFSKIHGRGLFTSMEVPKNSRIIDRIVDFKKKKVTYIGRFLNHAKKANVRLDKEGFLITLRDIKAHEELLIDYTKLPPPLDNNIKGFKEN